MASPQARNLMMTMVSMKTTTQRLTKILKVLAMKSMRILSSKMSDTCF